MSRQRLPWSVRASMAAYAVLLRAYPRRFRERYGAEMVLLFRDCCREAYRERGGAGLLRLWPGVLLDFARTAAQEWASGLRRPMAARRHLMHGSGGRLQMRCTLRRLRRGVMTIIGGRAYPVLAGVDMRDRFSRFTERARRTLALSQDEAHALGHGYIGSEHLLLGLLDEGGGVAAVALRNLGVDPERVRQRVGSILGRGEVATTGEVSLTPRSKRILELAVDEARLLGHDFVGTEHVLLGMIREGEGVGAEVLAEMGVRLDAAREETLRVLRGQSGGQ